MTRACRAMMWPDDDARNDARDYARDDASDERAAPTTAQHWCAQLDARRGAADLAGGGGYVLHYEREMARQECDLNRYA